MKLNLNKPQGKENDSGQWSLKVKTKTRAELINLSAYLGKSIKSNFMQNMNDIPIIVVPGDGGGGKCMVVEAMMKAILDQTDPDDMLKPDAPKEMFIEKEPMEACNRYCYAAGTHDGVPVMLGFDRCHDWYKNELVAAFNEEAAKLSPKPQGGIIFGSGRSVYSNTGQWLKINLTKGQSDWDRNLTITVHSDILKNDPKFMMFWAHLAAVAKTGDFSHITDHMGTLNHVNEKKEEPSSLAALKIAFENALQLEKVKALASLKDLGGLADLGKLSQLSGIPGMESLENLSALESLQALQALRGLEDINSQKPGVIKAAAQILDQRDGAEKIAPFLAWLQEKKQSDAISEIIAETKTANILKWMMSGKNNIPAKTISSSFRKNPSAQKIFSRFFSMPDYSRDDHPAYSLFQTLLDSDRDDVAVEVIRMAVEFLPENRLKYFLNDRTIYNSKSGHDECFLEKIYQQKRFTLVDALADAIDKARHPKISVIIDNINKSLAPYRPGAMAPYANFVVS
jgi:hypothetical protein